MPMGRTVFTKSLNQNYDRVLSRNSSSSMELWLVVNIRWYQFIHEVIPMKNPRYVLCLEVIFRHCQFGPF